MRVQSALSVLDSFFVVKSKKGGKVLNSIFKHTENNGEVIITGLQEGLATTSIVIPETIDGMPVIEIGPKAFQSTSITNIKIGENIKGIGEKAFYMCKKLKSVTWNHKCDVVPAFCFSECSNLTKFDFSNVKKIGLYAFYKSGLQEVCLQKNIKVLEEGTFSGCSKLQSVTWHCQCDVIPTDCFFGCSNLMQFDFLGVKKVRERAFSKSGLKEVCLPENIEVVSGWAFFECKKLSSVIWNCKCNVIPVDCFARCSDLTQFDFSNIKRIEVRAFRDSGLTSVTLSKGTAFGQSCFAQCNGLKKIEWLSGQNIEGKIFEGCKNIKEIFISDKVKNIEVSAFTSSHNAEITFV